MPSADTKCFPLAGNSVPSAATKCVPLGVRLPLDGVLDGSFELSPSPPACRCATLGDGYCLGDHLDGAGGLQRCPPHHRRLGSGYSTWLYKKLGHLSEPAVLGIQSDPATAKWGFAWVCPRSCVRRSMIGLEVWTIPKKIKTNRKIEGAHRTPW